MRQYPSLATVVEEVAEQSHHCSLSGFCQEFQEITNRHCCHCQGGRAAKSKDIADAPTLQSCHHC